MTYHSAANHVSQDRSQTFRAAPLVGPFRHGAENKMTTVGHPDSSCGPRLLAGMRPRCSADHDR
jgi:hypothetical protein